MVKINALMTWYSTHTIQNSKRLSQLCININEIDISYFQIYKNVVNSFFMKQIYKITKKFQLEKK